VWWQYIVMAAVLIFVVYCFLVIVGYRTRLLTHKTDRTAASMYGNYAESSRKQQTYARELGGQRRDDQGSTTPPDQSRDSFARAADHPGPKDRVGPSLSRRFFSESAAPATA
jgi:hypothetical protein